MKVSTLIPQLNTNDVKHWVLTKTCFPLITLLQEFEFGWLKVSKKKAQQDSRTLKEILELRGGNHWVKRSLIKINFGVIY